MWLNENLFNINTDDYNLSENELLSAKEYIQGNLFQMKISFREDVSTLKWYLFNKPFYFDGYKWTLALKYLITLKENGIESIDNLDDLLKDSLIKINENNIEAKNQSLDSKTTSDRKEQEIIDTQNDSKNKTSDILEESSNNEDFDLEAFVDDLYESTEHILKIAIERWTVEYVIEELSKTISFLNNEMKERFKEILFSIAKKNWY